MLLKLVRDRDTLFVGGKGGVGKTAIASAVALHQARAGRRVLLVSTDPAHNLGHLWGSRVGDVPTGVAPGLDALEIDPARTTDQHLAAVQATMVRLMPEHLEGEVRRYLDLARQAPGTHEAAVLERMALTAEEARESYDLLVFDTAPSGHTARLVAMPEIMQAWTDGLLARQDSSRRFGRALRHLGGDDDALADVLGTPRPAKHSAQRRDRRDAEIQEILHRRRDRLSGLRDLLQDQDRCAFAIVLAAERLPVLETVELHEQLSRTGIHVGGLVVNKRSPRDAGEFLRSRRAIEDGYLDQVRRALPSTPLVEIPLLPDDVVGEAGLERLLVHL